MFLQNGLDPNSSCRQCDGLVLLSRQRIVSTSSYLHFYPKPSSASTHIYQNRKMNWTILFLWTHAAAVALVLLPLSNSFMHSKLKNIYSHRQQSRHFIWQQKVLVSRRQFLPRIQACHIRASSGHIRLWSRNNRTAATQTDTITKPQT